MQSNEDYEDYYTRTQTAAILKISISTLDRYRNRNILPPSGKMGDRVLFLQSDIDNYIVSKFRNKMCS